MKLPFCKAKHVLWGVFSPPNAANDELNTLIKHILIVRSKDRPDAAALLQHPAVAARMSLVPQLESDETAEDSAETAEDGETAAVGRIKVPRQRKALAARDWLPSPRYAAAPSPDGADASGSAAAAEDQEERRSSPTARFESGQQRLVPLPIPTASEQAALRARFSAYAQQTTAAHELGRTQPIPSREPRPQPAAAAMMMSTMGRAPRVPSKPKPAGLGGSSRRRGARRRDFLASSGPGSGPSSARVGPLGGGVMHSTASGFLSARELRSLGATPPRTTTMRPAPLLPAEGGGTVGVGGSCAGPQEGGVVLPAAARSRGFGSTFVMV